MQEEQVGPQLNPETQLRAVLFGMEPEMRRLRAVISNLTVLATAQDPIEASALTVLTEVGREAAERVSDAWRQAFDLVRISRYGTTN